MNYYTGEAVTRGHSSNLRYAADDATKQPVGEWYYKRRATTTISNTPTVLMLRTQMQGDGAALRQRWGRVMMRFAANADVKSLVASENDPKPKQQCFGFATLTQ